MNYQQLCDSVSKTNSADWEWIFTILDKSADCSGTVVHLPYSSCWLFTTARDCRWCIDPAPRAIADNAARTAIANRLCNFDFCVLTHLHEDHYDSDLLGQMAQSGTVHFFIPEFMAQKFSKQVTSDSSRVTVLPLETTCHCKGIRLSMHPGYHNAPGRPPVPAVSLAVTLPDGVRLAFPCDVRDYSLPPHEGLMNPDWIFAHLWLGFGQAANQDFPMADDFCRFFLRFHPRHLMLGHLNEIQRDEQSLWNDRHARLVARKFHELSPELLVEVPRNGSSRLISAQPLPDHYEHWNNTKRQEFSHQLGVSIQQDVSAKLDAVIAAKIPVLELKQNVLKFNDYASLKEQLLRWRDTGGHCLSWHLDDVRLDDTRLDVLPQLIDLGVNRVTLHVPKFSVQDMRTIHGQVFDAFARIIDTLAAHNIITGIENMHMSAKSTPDDSRRFGCTINEWLEWVNLLRQRFGNAVGCHLDIGHAYTNFPFHQENTLEAWMRAGASLINGLHLHQYDTDRTKEHSFPDGHWPLTGRNAGYPLLEPLFRCWDQSVFRAPMFIEMRYNKQHFAISSRQRLLDASPCLQ